MFDGIDIQTMVEVEATIDGEPVTGQLIEPGKVCIVDTGWEGMRAWVDAVLPDGRVIRSYDDTYARGSASRTFRQKRRCRRTAT